MGSAGVRLLLSFLFVLILGRLVGLQPALDLPELLILRLVLAGVRQQGLLLNESVQEGKVVQEVVVAPVVVALPLPCLILTEEVVNGCESKPIGTFDCGETLGALLLVAPELGVVVVDADMPEIRQPRLPQHAADLVPLRVHKDHTPDTSQVHRAHALRPLRSGPEHQTTRLLGR